MRRRVLVALVAVVAVLTVITGALWALQRRLVHLPDTSPMPSAAAVLPGGEDVELTTSDGLRLCAWWFTASDRRAPAVLVAPGNGGARDLRLPLARALAAEGLSVLLFDYRGYGPTPAARARRG